MAKYDIFLQTQSKESVCQWIWKKYPTGVYLTFEYPTGGWNWGEKRWSKWRPLSTLAEGLPREDCCLALFLETFWGMFGQSACNRAAEWCFLWWFLLTRAARVLSRYWYQLKVTLYFRILALLERCFGCKSRETLKLVMDDEMWYQIFAMKFQMCARDGGDGRFILHISF